MRAVNQAMGRVIRHRWDYGAIILADERFRQPGTQKNMSRWVREHVNVYDSFGKAAASLTQFFKVGTARTGVAWDLRVRCLCAERPVCCLHNRTCNDGSGCVDHTHTHHCCCSLQDKAGCCCSLPRPLLEPAC